MSETSQPSVQVCLNCRKPIVEESMGKYMGSHLGYRWVHESSGIPMCVGTIAEPTPTTSEAMDKALREAGVPFTPIPDDATPEEADRLLAQHHAGRVQACCEDGPAGHTQKQHHDASACCDDSGMIADPLGDGMIPCPGRPS